MNRFILGLTLISWVFFLGISGCDESTNNLYDPSTAHDYYSDYDFKTSCPFYLYDENGRPTERNPMQDRNPCMDELRKFLRTRIIDGSFPELDLVYLEEAFLWLLMIPMHKPDLLFSLESVSIPQEIQDLLFSGLSGPSLDSPVVDTFNFIANQMSTIAYDPALDVPLKFGDIEAGTENTLFVGPKFRETYVQRISEVPAGSAIFGAVFRSLGQIPEQNPVGVECYRNFNSPIGAEIMHLFSRFQMQNKVITEFSADVRAPLGSLSLARIAKYLIEIVQSGRICPADEDKAQFEADFELMLSFDLDRLSDPNSAQGCFVMREIVAQFNGGVIFEIGCDDDGLLFH